MTRIQQNGFSLVEMSIVLLIMGVLSSSVVIPLVSTMKQARIKQTAAQLANIRQAMHGYLVSVGRLPCPVKTTGLMNKPAFSQADNNVVNKVLESVSDAAAEQHNRLQVCDVQHGGVPAAVLGVMGEQSVNGALLDAWGRPYHYSVSWSDHQALGRPGSPDWLSVGEPAAVGISNLEGELVLCRSVASSSCLAKDVIANQIVWVIVSEGLIQGDVGLQSENTDMDKVFVQSAFSSNHQQPFDDQLIWASRSELVYWLLRANWLP